MRLRSGTTIAHPITATPVIITPLLSSRSCTECQLEFSGKKSLSKHKRESHPPTFPCSLCSMSFPSVHHLAGHKQETHAPSRTCKKCNITFPNKQGLSNHRASHVMEYLCSVCHITFSKIKKVKAHQREVHETCRICRVKFLGLKELHDHQRKTDHLRCSECDLIFVNRSEHKVHVRMVQHDIEFRCYVCDREYECQESLERHCCDCDKVLLSEAKLRMHFTNPSHLRKIEALSKAANEERDGSPSSALHMCKICKEILPGKKSLKKHVSTHKPRRHIKCPVGVICVKKFASPGALLSHMESGHCKSGMTRARMTELVLAHDINHYITSPDTIQLPSPGPESAISNPRPPSHISLAPPYSLTSDLVALSLRADDDDDLSEWSIINSNQNNNGVCLSPAISEWSIIQGGVQLTPSSMHSDNISEFSFPNSTHGVALTTALSKSGLVQETIFCHLCPPTRKPFLTAERLQEHLLSPAHSPKIFYCPLSFLPEVKAEDLRKQKKFSTLSGLTQHLESGGCTGGVEIYQKAIAFVEQQFQMLGFGGIKLLLNE